MYTLLVIVFIVVCVFLILVVLLQQGKGADVAAAFGAASSQASFGPRGTTTLMHKLTTGSFVLFVVLCIGLSVMTGRQGRSVTSGVTGNAAEVSKDREAPCRSGGIGRRARLRGVWRKPCRFESGLRHHLPLRGVPTTLHPAIRRPGIPGATHPPRLST